VAHCALVVRVVSAYRLGVSSMSSPLRWPSHVLLLVLLAGSTLVAGCNTAALPPGAKPTKPTTATVTYKGAPVEGATVSFIDETGETPSYGLTDAQGVAKMKTSYAEGSVVGKHAVTISKTVTEGGAQADQDSPDYNPEGTVSVVKQLVPVKYGSKTSSGLEANVTDAGPNDFKFDLTD
jgi:hypothetical protein